VNSQLGTGSTFFADLPRVFGTEGATGR
jgi:hypothetical protein